MSYIRSDNGGGRAAVSFHFDGAVLQGFAGESVAAALAASGYIRLRDAPRSGAPRGAFCLMGVCQECLCRIDGIRREACRTPLAEGMRIESLG